MLFFRMPDLNSLTKYAQNRMRFCRSPWLWHLNLCPENEGSKHLRNLGILPQQCTWVFTAFNEWCTSFLDSFVSNIACRFNLATARSRVCRKNSSFLRGPFEKFVDSPYYSESELCGGAVIVSFSKYLPWQAMHFLQRSTHLSKTCCRSLTTSKFLSSELPFRIGRDLDCMADVLMGFHRSTFSKPNTEFNSDTAPCDFWAFPTMKRELRGKKFRSDQRSAARFREVGGAL
jgi:hypothetical protein